MLSVEEKKRCIEEFKPEGFHVNPNGFMFYEHIYLGKYKEDIQEGFNSLLLQRVIEGVNKIQPKHLTIVTDHFIAIHDKWDLPIDDFKTRELTDQAKEQAIKYILKQLAKNSI